MTVRLLKRSTSYETRSATKAATPLAGSGHTPGLDGATVTGTIMMAAYTLVVMSEPSPGLDDQYNDWYDREHLQDVLTTIGFTSARRLKLCEGYEAPHPYFAFYEIETDNPAATMAALMARAESGEWHVSEAFGPSKIMLLEGITPVVHPR